MSNNAKKDDVIVLGGRDFNRVKNGLDEAQVTSFIDELIEERDKLAQSQEHIASLTRLAEMTVVESDRLATQVKTEATEQATAENAAIIDKAKEQARQMVENKLVEAEEIANERANAIKAKAEEEAALLLENQKKKIQDELRDLVKQQFGYLLEEMESLKQQAAAIQTDFDSNLSQPGEEQSTVTEKITGERETAAGEIAKESDVIIAEEIEAAPVEIAKESDVIVAEEIEAAAGEIAKESDVIVAEEIKAAALEIVKESGIAAVEENKVPDESPEPSRAMDHTEKSFELSKLLQFEEQAELGKPDWEVEILPPFNVARVMEVVAFLDQLPQVANTEMIVPKIDMPSILVFLREPMNFVDVLQTIPAVAYVEEVRPDTAATNGDSRKVRIALSGTTMSQEKK